MGIKIEGELNGYYMGNPYLHFFDEDDNDYADVGAEFDVTLVKQG